MRECNRPVLFAVDGNVTRTATLRADDCVSDDCLSFLELLQLTAMHSQTSHLQPAGHLRMNEVNARRARLVPGWVTVFGQVYHLGM